MVSIVQSDWWVRKAMEAGGVCGCTWQSEREMWYTRSKLQQQLSVGKTFSPCLICGDEWEPKKLQLFFWRIDILQKGCKKTVYALEISEPQVIFSTEKLRIMKLKYLVFFLSLPPSEIEWVVQEEGVVIYSIVVIWEEVQRGPEVGHGKSERGIFQNDFPNPKWAWKYACIMQAMLASSFTLSSLLKTYKKWFNSGTWTDVTYSCKYGSLHFLQH